MKSVSVSYKRFNPNFHHLREALRDDFLRFIFLYGGSSSAKSFSVAQAILIECLSEGSNTLVFRKTGASISDSIYKTFKEAAKSIGILDAFQFKQNKIECFNGSYIAFKGLDDSEKIKGIESYKYIVCEELTEFDEDDLKQIKKRLRGKKGQKIVCMFNPISEEHWIKKNIFDKEDLHEVENHLYGLLKDGSGKILPKEYSTVDKKWINTERFIINPRTGKEEVHKPDTLIIRSNYTNNFWVVGSPDGSYGYYDIQVVADFDKDRERDYPYYRIYALGEWGTIKTGGEFLHAFDPGKHKYYNGYDSSLPVHLSVDDNLLPYISVSVWQAHLSQIKEIRQIHEICAEDPFNTVTKAAEMVNEYLKGVGYRDVVYVHGDATTQKGNTIDDEKRSFLDKFIDKVEDEFHVVDCVGKSNPSVSMSGEFINAILSGAIPSLSIKIGDSCKKSIHDYENVKKDVNGSILKVKVKNKETKQTYEELGHLTDTMRYVCVDIFKEEYTRFSLKRKRSKTKEDDMKYFNAKLAIQFTSKLAFVMPDCNGKSIAILVKVNEFLNIDEVLYRDTFDKSVLIEKLEEWGPDIAIIECAKSYHQIVHELRDHFENLDIRCVNEKPQKQQRVSALSEMVKCYSRVRSDYESHQDYQLFIESVMDYAGEEDCEAIYALSRACEYSKKTD